MADSKTIKWVDEYKDDSSPTAKPDSKVVPEEPAANDADGWQQYRRWISKAPAAHGQRSTYLTITSRNCPALGLALDAIARYIIRTGEFHSPLLDERCKEFVQ